VSHFINKFRELGFIELQRQHRSPQLAVERCSARSTADKKVNEQPLADITQ
jgi:hypothetical protein